MPRSKKVKVFFTVKPVGSTKRLSEVDEACLAFSKVLQSLAKSHNIKLGGALWYKKES